MRGTTLARRCPDVSVLARLGLFPNTSSDATLLRPTLEAAAEAVTPEETTIREDMEHLGIEPLFVRGVSDAV